MIYTGCNDFKEGKIKIQHCLNKVAEWCELNRLKINVSKTKFMLFYKSKDFRSRKEADEPISIYLYGETVERVLVFKYLGVNIDSCLSFKEHYNSVDKKLVAAIGKLFSLRRLLSPKVIKTFISAYVVSVVDYCIIIWAVQTDNEIDKLQNRINRFLLVYFYGNKYKKNKIKCKKSDALVLLRKIDLLTISERRLIAFVKFVWKKQCHHPFKDWFIKSTVNINRLVMSIKPNSVIYKQSVLWNCCNVWNDFVQKLKIQDIDEMPFCTFVDSCKNLLLQNREKLM